MPQVDELELEERQDTCPNCGTFVGDSSECENCGALLTRSAEIDEFDVDDDFDDA